MPLSCFKYFSDHSSPHDPTFLLSFSSCLSFWPYFQYILCRFLSLCLWLLSSSLLKVSFLFQFTWLPLTQPLRLSLTITSSRKPSLISLSNSVARPGTCHHRAGHHTRNLSIFYKSMEAFCRQRHLFCTFHFGRTQSTVDALMK